MVQRADPLYFSPLWASIEGTRKNEALRLGIPEQTQRAVSLGVPPKTLVALWQRGSYREDGKEPKKSSGAAPMHLPRHIRGTLLHETASDRYQWTLSRALQHSDMP